MAAAQPREKRRDSLKCEADRPSAGDRRIDLHDLDDPPPWPERLLSVSGDNARNWVIESAPVSHAAPLSPAAFTARYKSARTRDVHAWASRSLPGVAESGGH